MRTLLELECPPAPCRSLASRPVFAKVNLLRSLPLRARRLARSLALSVWKCSLAGLLAGCLLLAVAFPGCSRTPESTTSVHPDEHPASRESETSPSTSSDSLTLAPLDRAGYDTFLADHTGKVVLVDFWATWCTSCLEGFPQTVALHERYADQGLVVATVAVNEEEDEPQIVEFLQQQSAPFHHFRAAYSGAVNAMDAFDISSGTLPTLKLYDRSGALRSTFGNGQPFDHQQVEVTIRELLGEAG